MGDELIVDELLNTFGQTIKDAEQARIRARYIMVIENGKKQPIMKILFKLIRALKISTDTIFFLEIQHANKRKEHLIYMIHLCIERDLQVATATIKALKK